MRYLDIENWNRKDQYYFFKQMDYPHFNLCANIDITNLFRFIKERKHSLFRTMVYLTARTANSIEAFKYRMRGDGVVVHELIHPSFTVLSRDDAFSFCSVNYKEDALAFFAEVENKIKMLEGKVHIADEPGKDDLLFVTSIPWVSFTSIVHPVHINPTDSVPRISWGKFFEEGSQIRLPVSVQVNHALMDGIHVGKYFNLLQEMADSPIEYLAE